MSSLCHRIVIGDVPDGMLSTEQEEALRRATVVLLDLFFADVGHLEAGGDFADTDMVEYLPPRFASKYDHLFAKEILICVATVAGKLVFPCHSMLACVGEELALHALVKEAEGILEAQGAGADLADFLELATEDADYELLLSMAWDESRTPIPLGKKEWPTWRSTTGSSRSVRRTLSTPTWNQTRYRPPDPPHHQLHEALPVWRPLHRP